MEGFVVAFVRSRLRSYCRKSSGCSCADSRGCTFRSAQIMRVLPVAVLRDPMVWWCLQQSCARRAPPCGATAGPLPCPLSHQKQPSGVHQGFASSRATLPARLSTSEPRGQELEAARAVAKGRLSPSAPKGKGRRTFGVPGTQLGAGRKGWTDGRPPSAAITDTH